MIPAESTVHWMPSWRLVPSVFPPMSLFDRVATAEELDIVIAIESMTNDRLRDEIGELRLVPVEERQTGPGTTPVMAAFTHLNPEGSRFSDGSYGVYYAADTIDTALAETRYHRELFLQRTDEPPMEIDMRSYQSEIHTTLHDIRGQPQQWQAVYDKNSYAASQILAIELRTSGSNGLVYDSTRQPQGECVAIFRANIPEPVVQGSHYCFRWDGQKIVDMYRKVAI